MTIENPTADDMELIALNLHKEGEHSRSEALYKFVAKYKATQRETAAQAATIAQLREALEPFVSAYNENGGCVPITEDDREEMLYSIFNVISLDDFTRAACVLKGGE